MDDLRYEELRNRIGTAFQRTTHWNETVLVPFGLETTGDIARRDPLFTQQRRDRRWLPRFCLGALRNRTTRFWSFEIFPDGEERGCARLRRMDDSIGAPDAD
jgi:hypothetical protein